MILFPLVIVSKKAGMHVFYPAISIVSHLEWGWDLPSERVSEVKSFDQLSAGGLAQNTVMGRIQSKRKGVAITVCSSLNPTICVVGLLFTCNLDFISIFFCCYH